MKISHWIKAARLRTLFLSLSCIWAGILLVQTQQEVNLQISLFTFLTALFLQILSNFANDYGDSIHGADNQSRKGPSRAVQSGLITKHQMKAAMFVFAALAFISGCILLYLAKPLIGALATYSLLAIGILAIIAAIAYTNGKKPYGYDGLGDISVFIFFGLVAVIGTQYLQTTQINYTAIMLACAFGLLSVGVLNLNNMRDISSDKLAGKKSIPVRLGLAKAKIYHSSLLILSLICLLLVAKELNLTVWVVPAFSLIIGLNLFLAAKVKVETAFDPLLKWLSLSSLVLIFILFLAV
jgi:1,4-dihydroxy-2-naphthoate octaprenyltransferase